MARAFRRIAFAVMLFVAGVFIGNVTSTGSSVFRLAIDAPAGDTNVTCDGCEFLSWVDGRVGKRQRSISLSCADGRCSQAVGGVIVDTSAPHVLASTVAGLPSQH